MEALSRWFEKLLFDENIPGGAGSSNRQKKVITFIGSGGKTALLWLLARQFAQRSLRVLVSPTTKMYIPDSDEHLYDYYYNGVPPAPLAGVTLAGTFNEKTGKLESLPLPALEQTAAAYDVVLIEGDGSKELPLKGWAGHEPLVPCFTDITVGILPIWPLGMPVSETIIHRLPLFCALSGASPGETLNLAHLAAVISGKGAENTHQSLFTAAQGQKILFFNQIEDEAAFSAACKLVSLLPADFCSGLHSIIAGNVRQDIMQEIT